MRWPALAAGLFVIAVALVLRVGDLSSRPLHNDEAINAVKLDRLWRTGDFRYDPHEYHGPTLYYGAWAVGKVSAWIRGVAGDGPDIDGMRWVSVVAGMGLIAATAWGWARAGMSRGAAGIAGLALAVSPSFVYYSRYFIHEMLLVALTAGAIAAGWRYARQPGPRRAAVFGIWVGLMYATKETFVFNLSAMGAGWIVWEFAEARSTSSWMETARTAWRRGVDRLRTISVRHAGVAVLAFVGTAAVWFTSFGRHPEGALDAVKTYGIWFQRAGGASPHIHSAGFYWERLLGFRERGGPLWTEASIGILGLAGLVFAFRRLGDRGGSSDRGFLRFVAGYTLALALIYSVLPYKTPWCALGFWHGFAVLAGVAVHETWQVWRSVAVRVALVGVSTGVAGHLAWQSWRATREYAADFRNPYVYGHTSADVTNLLEQIREVAAADAAGTGVRVHVMMPESGYWPLPWYLRDFANVGWWDRVPEEPYAPIMVVAARLRAGFEERSRQGWLMVGLFELRPRYFVELYVEAGLWERFLAARRAARATDGG